MIEDPSVEPTAEELQTESLIESKVPKGEDSVTDSTLGGVSFFAMIGAGNGAKGARGARDGGGIHRAIGVGLGGPWTTRAIDASLDWFARHQDPTGKWDPATYFQNCADDAKCEPGNAGQSGAIPAVTAYAMMTMVHAGNDHVTPSRYKKNVARAVQWLVANQQADGSWGRNYENAIVVMALAELVSMTNDLALAKVTQRGVGVILARQTKDPAAKDPTTTPWPCSRLAATSGRAGSRCRAPWSPRPSAKTAATKAAGTGKAASSTATTPAAPSAPPTPPW